MIPRRSPLAALLMISSLLATSSAFAGIVIDNFEEGPFALDLDGTNSGTQSGLSPSNVIGGDRQVLIMGLASFIDATTSLSLCCTENAVSVLVEGTPNGGISETDFLYGTTSGYLGVDLTTDGSNAFRIDYEMAHSASGPPSLVGVIVNSSSGAGPGWRYRPIDRNSAGTILVPFSDHNGVDFSNVFTIGLRLRSDVDANDLQSWNVSRFETTTMGAGWGSTWGVMSWGASATMVPSLTALGATIAVALALSLGVTVLLIRNARTNSRVESTRSLGDAR